MNPSTPATEILRAPKAFTDGSGRAKWVFCSFSSQDAFFEHSKCNVSAVLEQSQYLNSLRSDRSHQSCGPRVATAHLGSLDPSPTSDAIYLRFPRRSWQSRFWDTVVYEALDLVCCVFVLFVDCLLTTCSAIDEFSSTGMSSFSPKKHYTKTNTLCTLL